MTARAVHVTKFGGPEVLKVVNIPIPTPKDGEVLIRVHSAGVNPVDTYIREGLYTKTNPPFISGGDAAGVVETVGENVTEFKKGDRVYVAAAFTGTYAEYISVSVRYVALLSDSLSFAQGASIGIPYYTSFKALYIIAHAKPGDIVLVHGASGAVGIAAVQIALANGQRVFGTAGTEQGVNLVKKLGAEQVFNHREEGYMDQILKATDGKGVNVILEMLANVNLDKDLDILAFRGRVVIVGCRGNIEINPRKTMFKETSIIGTALLSIEDEREWTQIKADAQAGQSAGWLVPIVAKEYKLEEAGQAQFDIINNTGTFGKLVLNTARD
uniref:Enoyl reductase (ER) domain-containing protein n=1 Tax=Arion vulgaris TaxID=1028688 RepID=A0A0B7BBV4_9EUPU